MNEILCPCGSQLTYHACCGPFHEGLAIAPTAEALMRSRYSAFVKQRADYLVQTLHPSRRRPDESAALEQSFRDTQWQSLIILAREAGREDDDEGTVEFIALYRAGHQDGRLHERSRFVKNDGRWFYLDGDMITQAPPGRNDPCWCGSGKKFKKCHG